MTHANGILYADRYNKTRLFYLLLVIPEEMMLMGYTVPNAEGWKP